MKDYLLCILASALISGMITMLVSGSYAEKYIKYLCALVCVSVTVSPLIKLSFDYKSDERFEEVVPAIDDNGTELIENTAAKQINEYINQLIFDKFGITDAYVSINISDCDQTLTVESILLYINESTNTAPAEIEEYLLTVIGGKIKVEYREGS